MVFGSIERWLDARAQEREQISADTRRLIAAHPRNCYYNAQRLAARARAKRDLKGYVHWTHVAGEIARTCPTAEMNYSHLVDVTEDEFLDESAFTSEDVNERRRRLFRRP